MIKFKKRVRNRQNRNGVESVEVAITLPLLMIAMFAAVQMSHRIHIEKLLRVAAYEAIKVGASTDGDSSKMMEQFRDHCDALGINNATLTFDANSFDRARVGDSLVVEASAPEVNNRLPAPVTLRLSATLTGGPVHYRKEGL